jgi:hypothetical protein
MQDLCLNTKYTLNFALETILCLLSCASYTRRLGALSSECPRTALEMAMCLSQYKLALTCNQAVRFDLRIASTHQTPE